MKKNNHIFNLAGLPKMEYKWINNQMSIYICTPSSFFNIIQKYNYHVYDFRIDHSKSLKNTTLVTN